jgi:putative copper resistance protein D
VGAETLIAGRLLQYAGAAVLLGSPLFFLYGTQAPNTADLDPWPWERRLLLGAALTALIGALIWLMAETVSMSGEPADAVHPAALWMVASETRFGMACCVRIALLALSVGACFALTRPKSLWSVQVILGSAITMSFAWTGHGATEIGKTAGVHLAADLLHLLAAGIWLGAVVPLAVLGIRARQSGAFKDGHALRFGLKEFSSVGVWVVVVLVFSGILNSLFLVDLAHWREALNSAYGRVLLVKLALFSGMLGFAARHRYHTTPGLEQAMQRRSFPAVPVKAAASSLLIETVLAALVLGAVSVLGTWAPPDVQTSLLK